MNLRKLILLRLTVLLLLGSLGPVLTFAEGEALPIKVHGQQQTDDASPSSNEGVIMRNGWLRHITELKNLKTA
ncbi:hypothetical protein D3C77_619040 [compost metagenome]